MDNLYTNNKLILFDWCNLYYLNINKKVKAKNVIVFINKVCI
jgi:hypothetical protein